jgi:hypothetical protein
MFKNKDLSCLLSLYFLYFKIRSEQVIKIAKKSFAEVHNIQLNLIRN